LAGARRVRGAGLRKTSAEPDVATQWLNLDPLSFGLLGCRTRRYVAIDAYLTLSNWT
jgi:hypothetical protein